MAETGSKTEHLAWAKAYLEDTVKPDELPDKPVEIRATGEPDEQKFNAAFRAVAERTLTPKAKQLPETYVSRYARSKAFGYEAALGKPQRKKPLIRDNEPVAINAQWKQDIVANLPSDEALSTIGAIERYYTGYMRMRRANEIVVAHKGEDWMEKAVQARIDTGEIKR